MAIELIVLKQHLLSAHHFCFTTSDPLQCILEVCIKDYVLRVPVFFNSIFNVAFLYRVLDTMRYFVQVRVVEEAIRYIDELHMALFRRAPIIAGESAVPACHYAFFAVINYSVRG